MTTLRALVMDYGGVLTDGPRMLGLVRRAGAAGVVTALVTDALSVPAACAAEFGVVVLGDTWEIRKPDPEVFRRVAARLDVTPPECVVVDDLLRNVRGARTAGAVVVHHRDADTTVAEVEILLGLA